MSSYSDEKRRRIAQFATCLRQMGTRAINALGDAKNFSPSVRNFLVHVMIKRA